jgi:hypothetical protein
MIKEKRAMKGTMLIMRPTEDYPETKYYDQPPSLDELKTAIGGGWLETVPAFTTIGVSVRDGTSATVMDCVAFCDEESKLKKAPLNEGATAAWEQSVRRIGETNLNDFLTGTVVVLFGDREFMNAI